MLCPCNRIDCVAMQFAAWLAAPQNRTQFYLEIKSIFPLNEQANQTLACAGFANGRF